MKVSSDIFSHKCINKLTASGLDVFFPFVSTSETFSLIAPYLIQQQQRKTFAMLLIGNTKSLWPKFLSAYKTFKHEKHPLDFYIEKTMQSVMKQFHNAKEQLEVELFLVHKSYQTKDQPNKFIPFQRLAVASGLGWFHEPTHLCLHPKYGPWISFRALLVFSSDSESHLQAFIKSELFQLHYKLPEHQKWFQKCQIPANEEFEKEENFITKRRLFRYFESFEFSEKQQQYHHSHNKALLEEKEEE